MKKTATTKSVTTKSATAKKAATKKAATKKAATKKAATKKAATKKAATKKAATKKAPARSAATKTAPAKTAPAKKTSAPSGAASSKLIDAKIKSLDDWRGKTLAHVRALIKQADPEVVEEWKWSVPVWSHDGIICTGETYKSAVKLTFARGAAVRDPQGLFNSSLEGNTRRAIDIHEGDEIDEAALKALIRAAAALNKSLK